MIVLFSPLCWNLVRVTSLDDRVTLNCKFLEEIVSINAFRDYQLRITKPNLCDTTVKQYSGYLDIANGKHLFFWYVRFAGLCLFFMHSSEPQVLRVTKLARDRPTHSLAQRWPGLQLQCGPALGARALPRRRRWEPHGFPPAELEHGLEHHLP
jgi:hypothetical protein